MRPFTHLLLAVALFILTFVATDGLLAAPYPDGLPDQSPGQGRGVNYEQSTTAAADPIFCLPQNKILSGAGSSAMGNDIWGYKAPDGREYVLMGVWEGITVMDAATMEVIGTVEDCLPGNIWRDIKTYGHYFYATTECGGTGRGLLIVDLSGLPNSINVIGTQATSNFSNWHNLQIDTTAGYAYLASQNNGFLILDLTNPENPSELGFVNTGGCHDLYVDNDTAWVAESFSPFFSVWDLTDKFAPTRIAHVAIPAAGFVHNVWASPDRSFAVTTEETTGKTVKIWNTSDLSNVFIESEFLAPNGLAHNAFITGDTIWLSHYGSGVIALDASDLQNPTIIDQFTTWPDQGSTSFDCWGIYPFTSSGRIFASNINMGEVYVFQPAGAEADTTFGAAPLQVNFSGVVCGDVTSFNWQFGDGDSAIGNAVAHTYTEPGLYQVNFSASTTKDFIDELGPIDILVHGDTVLIDTLSQLNTEPVRIDVQVANKIPVDHMTIPFSWAGGPALKFDSISTDGLRTATFQLVTLASVDSFNKRATVYLQASTGGGTSQLDPGDGPVVSLYFTPLSDDEGIVPLNIISYSAFEPIFAFSAWSYFPTTVSGQVELHSPPCCVGRVGDVNGNGSDEPTVSDIGTLVDFMFISGASLPCLEEADTNGSGGGTPTGDDISVADIGVLVDYLFITGSPLLPCP